MSLHPQQPDLRGFDGALVLEHVGGALAICSTRGELVAATPPARELLRRLGLDTSTFPHPLPSSLWQALASTAYGEAAEWAPADGSPLCLGCTPYPIEGELVLLLMSEVSEKHRALSQRLHKQRLESVGRFVASVAHDIRSILAPIVFNASALIETMGPSTNEPNRASLEELVAATDRLRRLVDELLDFARVGPPRVEQVSLATVFARTSGLMRGLLRDGGHAIEVELEPNAVFVRSNAMIIEQALVNLLTNAMEAAPGGVRIMAKSSLAEADGKKMVRLLITDDGPGIPAAVRASVFTPFFTTKQNGTGLGLSTTRDALRDLDGDLQLEPGSTGGASFAVLLPADDSNGASS